MIEALRWMVLDCFGDMEWRHHGIGVLQAYVREHREPEVRVHIWHPDLVRPGIYDSGSIHDHRFDLESTVLVGALHERIFRLRPNVGGAWRIFHVENARSAGESRGFDGDCHPLSDERFDAGIAHRTHLAGTTYTLNRGVFHETRITALAVSVCVMHQKRGSARLLVPHDREPVHAFGTPAPEETRSAVLREAFVALGGER